MAVTLLHFACTVLAFLFELAVLITYIYANVAEGYKTMSNMP